MINILFSLRDKYSELADKYDFLSIIGEAKRRPYYTNQAKRYGKLYIKIIEEILALYE